MVVTQKAHSKSAPAKAAKTVTSKTTARTTTSSIKTKSNDHKTHKTAQHHTVHNTSTTHKSTKQSKSKLSGIIIAILTAVAVIIAIVVIAVTSMSGNSLIVKNGNGDKITTSYRSFDENAFQVKVPVEFTELDKNAITEKYGSDAPNYVYSDTDNNVNITVKLTDSTLTNGQVEEYLNTVEAVFNASGNIISTDSYAVGDYNVATIQLNSESTIGNYYNNMLFFSQKDKLVVISFNCPFDQKDVWQPVGEFVIESLKF